MNWPYVSAVLAAATVALGFVAWSVSTRGFADLQSATNTIAVVVVDSLCGAALAALSWRAYADAKTKISDRGITRPALRGPNELLWSEVREVKRFGYGIHLYAHDRRVVIAPFAYRDPEAIVKAIVANVAHLSITDDT
jgi:hypothetical protein